MQKLSTTALTIVESELVVKQVSRVSMKIMSNTTSKKPQTAQNFNNGLTFKKHTSHVKLN